MKKSLRNIVQRLSRLTPSFTGKGRVILFLDRFLTDSKNKESYLVQTMINGDIKIRLDLRGNDQKFAFYYGELENDHITEALALYERGVFIDVGASIGLYSCPAATKSRRFGASVIAVEPLPTNLSRLKENLTLNDVQACVVIVNTALGLEKGVVRMELNPEGSAGNAKISGTGEFEVPIITLDELWESNNRPEVGFIKSDTEGWDADILLSGKRLIETCRPNILAEFNRERMLNNAKSIDNVWNWLVGSLHYRCYSLNTYGQRISMTEPGDVENLFFCQVV